MSVFDLFAKLLLAQKAAGSPILAELRRLAKNEIRMESNAAQTPAPDGCKIGGKPYLPRDFVWPTFVSPDDGVDRPLSFFCQIDLAEIRPYDKENLLPARGILSFFYECQSSRWGFDPNDKGAARVFFFENTEGFAPCDPPSDLEADFEIPEIAVAFTTDLSYPGYEELAFHSARQCDWEEYDETIETFLGFSPEERSEIHKLLGYAGLIQGEILSECERAVRGLSSGSYESYENTPEAERADIREKATDWILLCQLTTIQTDDFEWMFGDCGNLYYYIKKEDLAAKRFDHTWFSVQCG